VAHRRVTRTTNLLERLFGEERRRIKVIPHAFSERAVMKLMFAAPQRARATWRGVTITESERKQMGFTAQRLGRGVHRAHGVNNQSRMPHPKLQQLLDLAPSAIATRAPRDQCKRSFRHCAGTDTSSER
jgi:hypothetical protein